MNSDEVPRHVRHVRSGQANTASPLGSTLVRATFEGFSEPVRLECSNKVEQRRRRSTAFKFVAEAL
jgi:hypothetical protein